MNRSDEGMTPEHEQDIAQDERDAEETGRANAGDPEHNSTPPGNPETDDGAVEKGEDNLGRIAGR
jgi:hypothetical protein